MTAIRARSVPPHLVLLGGIVLLGGVLRFSTLDLQSYRYDEAVTVGRVLHANFFDTFAEVPHSESTPPLYYLLAWAWSKPFGAGEAWMRSLSALAGTASIAIVYLGAVALPLPRRAGADRRRDGRGQPGADLVLPGRPRLRARLHARRALVPLLRARPPRRGAPRPRLVGGGFRPWRLATHYFAGFLIAPEAALAAPRAQSSRRRARDPGDRRDGRAAGPDRARTIRTRTRGLDRRPADRTAARTGGRQAGRRRQRRRARASPGRRDPAGRAGGARGPGGAAAALARRAGRAPRRRPGRTGRRHGGRPAAAARGRRAGLLRRPQPAARFLTRADRDRRRLRRPAGGLGGPRRGGGLLSLLALLHVWRSTACRACSARICATRPPRSEPSVRGRRWSRAATRPASHCATTSARNSPVGRCRRCARSIWSARQGRPAAPRACCRGPSGGWNRSPSPTTSRSPVTAPRGLSTSLCVFSSRVGSSVAVGVPPCLSAPSS